MEFSEDTVRRYRADGFVRVPGVLTADEVTAFREASEELLAEEAEIWAGGEQGEHVEVVYVTQAWRKHRALRRLAMHPRIHAIAARLARLPLRLYTSEVLVKEPKRSTPTLVHDDETGLPLDGLSETLSAWVALGDVPVERGCLSYVPGSHLREESACQRHMNSFEEFADIDAIWPEFPWRSRVTVPLRAGDVAFHHCRTVHMAGANETAERRVGHGVIFVDAGAAYRPGVQDQHLAHMRPGELLAGDEVLFPPVVAGSAFDRTDGSAAHRLTHPVPAPRH
ncbi:phytanoyl-CoA dioxygenase family protein [Spirillospora sp. NBC_00431]